VNTSDIRSILKTLGEQVPPNSKLVLIGGSALALLGSQRPTIDIDFVGDDVKPEPLHQAIMQTALELKIYLEPVPFHRFVPLPPGSDQRAIYIDQFGNLDVYVADPYSIALTKLDRGLDTDLDDILFLSHHHYVSLEELERLLFAALPTAGKYDFNPDILAHLQVLKSRGQ
jgi:hypothetical protein